MITGSSVGVTLPVGNVSTLTYDGLVDLVASVDPAYATPNSVFLMHSSTLAALRKVKDTTGNPVVQQAGAGSFPSTLFGYRIEVDQAFPVPAANATSIAFGDVRSAFVIRDVRSFEVLQFNERWGDFLQIGFLGYHRTDSKVQDSNAVKLLKHSAT